MSFLIIKKDIFCCIAYFIDFVNRVAENNETAKWFVLINLILLLASNSFTITVTIPFLYSSNVNFTYYNIRVLNSR